LSNCAPFGTSKDVQLSPAVPLSALHDALRVHLSREICRLTNTSLGIVRKRGKTLSTLLWSDGDWSLRRRLSDTPASKEVVAHHALGKQNQDDYQDDRKQEISNPERGWLFSTKTMCI